MTVRQVAEWVHACSEASISRAKEQAALLNGQAIQIISGIGGMLDRKIKYLTLGKLYPELFGPLADLKDLSPEQQQQRGVAAWRAFLAI